MPEAHWSSVDIKPEDVKRLMVHGSIIVQGTKIRLLSRKLIPPIRIEKKWDKFWRNKPEKCPKCGQIF